MEHILLARQMLHNYLAQYIGEENIKVKAKIENYTVDFLLFGHFIIEIDYSERNSPKYEKKHKILTQMGYFVKRVKARRVYSNPNSVAKEIASLIFPNIS
ncbi:MAG: DUF559 domain-containing protein [Candidatus Aenigmatarchaeota archaeon]